MSIRTERVGATIREELAKYLQRSAPDYLDGMVTVTSVRVSSDLSIAKVYVSIWKSTTKPEILIKRLNENQVEIRTHLARALQMRKTPELRFYRDDTLDTAESMEKLIREVRAEDERRAAASGRTLDPLPDTDGLDDRNDARSAGEDDE